MTTVSSPSREPDNAKASKFRPDIQGLRAIAVLLVVLYHSGVQTLSGGFVGVDAFFVISGFLITTHLLESLVDRGRISFSSFYARRARRILPAALLVAGLTTLASLLWMPPLLLGEVVKGAIATAVYVPNMLFAVQGTNYLAESSPSVFQHYWSLGIEEQFYLAWPALLALGFVLVRRDERRLGFLALVVTFCSFLLCVLWMDVSQPWTFFVLPTRAWELGAGALTAFLLRSGARWIQRPTTGLLAWAGLAGLLAVGLLYDEKTPFPSWTAALPVLATVALIIGGTAPGGMNATRLLSLRPFQFFGAISYSLYLVHWPLQVIPQTAVGQGEPLPLVVRLLLGAVSVPLAWLLFRFVERPVIAWPALRQRKAGVTGLAALAASVALIATAGGVHLASESAATATDQVASDAEELSTDPEGTTFVPSNLEPALDAAKGDNPAIYDNGCHRSQASSDSSGCRIGENSEAPLVFLFGDSHAASWYPALAQLVEEGRIRLDTNTKSSCPSVDVRLALDGVDYTACEEWRDGVLERISEEQPDLVILANYAAAGAESIVGGEGDLPSLWRAGMESTLSQIDGPEVVVLADVPHQDETPAVCLSDHLEDAQECAAPVADALSSAYGDAEKGAADRAGATYLDMTPYLCNATSCPTIIGRVLVYRDAHHLTATFSARMAVPLWKSLAPLLG